MAAASTRCWPADFRCRGGCYEALPAFAERPAAASFTAVPRGLAAAASPAIAGALFAGGFEAWPLVICGVLKIAYDLLLLQQFRHLRPPDDS
jgi:hypothetical protein